MLELHQFRHSAFCEKVRLVLAAKGLDYSVVEVVPGVGQLEVYRLSGQRQVPVLVDGPEVIADSTAIALHLEAREPQPALLPADPAARAQVRLLEDWADTTLAAGARLALVQAAAADPVLRTALLPEAAPSALRQLVSALPGGLMAPVGSNQVKSFQFFAEKFSGKNNPAGVNFEVIALDNKLSPAESLNQLKAAIDQGEPFSILAHGTASVNERWDMRRLPLK